jgi:hypothetical protein
MPQEELKLAIRIGGGLVAALGAFPSTKYLQRRDRASALQMISREYERLHDSPARKQLDNMINGLVRGMIK